MDIIYGLCHETTSNLKTRLSFSLPSNFSILKEADQLFLHLLYKSFIKWVKNNIDKNWYIIKFYFSLQVSNKYFISLHISIFGYLSISLILLFFVSIA